VANWRAQKSDPDHNFGLSGASEQGLILGLAELEVAQMDDFYFFICAKDLFFGAIAAMFDGRAPAYLGCS
jgi:hypothetical protein